MGKNLLMRDQAILGSVYLYKSTIQCKDAYTLKALAKQAKQGDLKLFKPCRKLTAIKDTTHLYVGEKNKKFTII